MQNRFLLGVSVGESFAEYCLLEGTEVLATKRAYLSRESLKNSLQLFLSDHSDKKIAKAAVTLRVSTKLLDYKLNGAIAHITTEGFAHWLDLHKCTETSPRLSLTLSDLQFSLRERVQANGQISIPLAISDLETIAAKLQLLNTKRVCLHLLHASLNPTHEMAAKNFLSSKGFEVFIPEKTDNADEVSRWKKNALNATVAGLFSDLKKDLQETLQNFVAAENIHYLTAQGEFVQDVEKNSVASLAAAYSALALAQNLAQNNSARDILYLGLESFVLISSKNWKTLWASPWGDIENKHVGFRELAIQPTLEIALNAFQHFDFNSVSEGWEPGPMFLGRGQKIALLDLWSEHPKLAKTEGLQDRVTAAGVQRFKNSMFALSRASRMQNKELPHVTKELQSLAMQKLAMESLLFRHDKNLLVTGPLADIFANGFKKDSTATIEVDEFALSRSLALLGQSLLKG